MRHLMILKRRWKQMWFMYLSMQSVRQKAEKQIRKGRDTESV